MSFVARSGNRLVGCVMSGTTVAVDTSIISRSSLIFVNVVSRPGL